MIRVLVAVLAIAGASANPSTGGREKPADIVWTHAVVHTLSPGNPRAEAIAVRGDRIVYVGDADGARHWRGDRTRWIDLGGATVVPGLVDAHGHLRNLGRTRANVQLTGLRSLGACVARVRDAQKDTPAGRWIRGRGWDESDWIDSALPTWRDLEGTEANPIYLRRVDGHSAWLNRTALERCGISRDTPDPPGGRILRDGDGEPTGVVVDRAEDLVVARIPAPTPGEMDGWMRAAIAECNRKGLVGVHDAGTTSAMVESWQRLAASGELNLRIYAMLSAAEEELSGWLDRGPVNDAGGRLRIQAVKIYADGSVGSHGAALHEPYSDDPTNRGIVINDSVRIETLTVAGLRAGFQTCVHAIGDRANTMVLDAYERALQQVPVPDHRLRVEHCQVLSPTDIGRFASQGVIASMQPTHCTSDMVWVEERLGPARARRCYAWRSLLDTGVSLAFGSDFPVEDVNPLWGLYAAVTRRDHQGEPPGGWQPQEALSMEEAIRAFTAGAAWASFAEDDAGIIAPGRWADLTILDRDIFAIPPPELLGTRVRQTVVAGEIVYSATP